MNDVPTELKPSASRQTLQQRLSRDAFIALHHQQGFSQKAIAKRFDISIAYVIRLRKQYNIPTNTKAQKLTATVKKTRVSLEAQTNPKEIRRLYHEEKLSCDGIAKRFNVSRKTVWKYLGRHGIDARDKTESRRNAITEGRIIQVLYTINEDFFATWSPAMAWVLGLILTDGHIGIGPSGMLVPELSSISLPLLERVRSCMASNHPIKLVNQTLGGTIYRFTFCRRKLADDLVALGITPKKSLTVQFPPVPVLYLSHFIRGVFDGDGSVFVDPRARASAIRVNFVSGSWDFISQLENKLHSLAGV
ncbi:MAG: HTH domain-containing protein, partial [Lentisphaerae bacterium]|nr:HTH domain-containing protein [Lentisphaerota bacterium]